MTANESGILHSFELSPSINGRPTEQVIRGNQYPDWDQDRLRIHVGDAQETAIAIDGTIDFALLDSCHEDWFAKWYIETILPRIEGPVVIQDITFLDQLEPSSEAQYVWDWINSVQIPISLIGAVEVDLEQQRVRSGYPKRSGLRSNAVVMQLPTNRKAAPPQLSESPIALIEEAELAVSDPVRCDQLLNRATDRIVGALGRANRHRDLVRIGRCYSAIGEVGEADRCMQKALGTVLQTDVPDRDKGLRELLGYCLEDRRMRMAAQLAVFTAMDPHAWLGLFSTMRSLVQDLAGRARGKLTRLAGWS